MRLTGTVELSWKNEREGEEGRERVSEGGRRGEGDEGKKDEPLNSTQWRRRAWRKAERPCRGGNKKKKESQLDEERRRETRRTPAEVGRRPLLHHNEERKGNERLTSMIHKIARVNTNQVANMKTTKRVLKNPPSAAVMGNDPSRVML